MKRGIPFHIVAEFVLIVHDLQAITATCLKPGVRIL